MVNIEKHDISSFCGEFVLYLLLPFEKMNFVFFILA